VFIFRDLKFVDSSGIGALLSCLRRAHAAGGDVKLAELQPGVKQLFELVRMNRLFEIFETLADARQSFPI
jgi:anti-sigma B factor antagonist